MSGLTGAAAPDRYSRPVRTSSSPQRHVLVVNQHGDNTGDEAALRAMLDGLAERIGAVRFTVLHQFREASSCVDTPHDVRWQRLVLSPMHAIGLVLHTLGALLGLRFRWLLGPDARGIVDAYASADLVVSAPGGPYFGDLYWNHEPVHWFYVWLARANRRPVGLYATSAGPFRIRVFNPWRRATYRCFDRVVLREDVSARHVRQLTAGRVHVEVTADSALQQRVPAQPVADWSGAPPPDDAVVVAVSAIDRPYDRDPDPEGRRRRYDASIAAAVAAIADRSGRPVHVAFVPQLQSIAHDDTAYLRRLGHQLVDAITWEVVGGGRTSVEQRGVFAAADLVVAGRYHPAVFAVSAEVPVLCIPYEHKAAGLMAAAGLSEFTVELDDVSPERLAAVAADLWERRAEVRETLARTEPVLRELSGRTSDLMVELIP